jgi:hypothetical protein
MPANPFNAFTDYGIGIGLRVPHYRHILEKKPVVDWFEIISENFMVDGGRPLEVLDSILEQYRVVQHGVAIYFGSADKLNREHLKKLKRKNLSDKRSAPTMRPLDRERYPIPIGTEGPPTSDGSHSVSSADRALENAEAHG